MTPEEAYEMTERKWKAIAGGDLDIDPGSMTDCGFCRFARVMVGTQFLKVQCNMGHCPVPAVFGSRCIHLDWLQDCISVHEDPLGFDYLDLAQVVLAQLVSHKEQLIREMEKIRGEKRSR